MAVNVLLCPRAFLRNYRSLSDVAREWLTKLNFEYGDMIIELKISLI